MKQVALLIGLISSVAWISARVLMVKAMRHPVVAFVTIVAVTLIVISRT
jgi:hypothetical protein